MNAHHQDARRAGIALAARRLAKDAREAAAATPAGSRQWRFYHGVQTAAHHVLRPQVEAVRAGTAWLDAEDPAFREGFLNASGMLAAAAAAAQAPPHLRLPVPRVRPATGAPGLRGAAPRAEA